MSSFGRKRLIVLFDDPIFGVMANVTVYPLLDVRCPLLV